ncbi:DegV family protein [Reinekea sp. G2M2-21]|uniref:DegV family protein n=1 Tax=Reinekea sp. G2M2-21 TaxID=2788942 RepID=UPI0018A9598D|nr:DegV family protein [Reinekea sp. G2M2-21]
MPIQVIADTGCDLPQTWLNRHGIPCLPGVIRHRGYRHNIQTYYDSRDDTFSRWLHDNGYLLRGTDISTDAPGEEYLISWAHEHCDPNSECFTITLDGSITNGLANWTRSSRKWSKETGGICIVFDSKTALSGQGLIVWAAIDLIKKHPGITGPQLADLLRPIADSQTTLIIVKDLSIMINRGAQKLKLPALKKFANLAVKISKRYPIFKSHVGFFKHLEAANYESAVARVLSDTCELIEQGRLEIPVVVVSYAISDVVEIDYYREFRRLRELCSENLIDLQVSRMSNAGAINLGQGALSISYLTSKT